MFQKKISFYLDFKSLVELQKQTDTIYKLTYIKQQQQHNRFTKYPDANI